jgi:hypothetical protein
MKHCKVLCFFFAVCNLIPFSCFFPIALKTERDGAIKINLNLNLTLFFCVAQSNFFLFACGKLIFIGSVREIEGRERKPVVAYHNKLRMEDIDTRASKKQNTECA